MVENTAVGLPAEYAVDEKALMEITPPAGMSDEELQAVQEQAEALSMKILSDPDDRSAMRETLSVGDGLQDKTNGEFKLLRTSLGNMMNRLNETGDATTIPRDLNKLRDIMDEINPYPAIEQLKKSQTAGFFSRLFKSVPGIGKVLSDIARRYESVQAQVDAIIISLESGSDKLLENSIEIEERYNNLKLLQREVKSQAYVLKVAAERINQALVEKDDPTEKQRLQKIYVRLMRRLQNLWVTAQAFSQFFITMNVTMDNHENLRDAIRSMTGLTRPVLENGLALKIAQQEEKQIAEALAATQDYLGGLMKSIAEDAMADAASIAEVTNQPLIKFKDLVSSYKLLMNRMDEAARIEAKMLESAKRNVDELETMTAELEKRGEIQESARDAFRNL